MKNSEAVAALTEIADLLEMSGESQFRIRAYRRAAEAVAELSEPVEAALARDAHRGAGDRLRDRRGAGRAVAARRHRAARRAAQDVPARCGLVARRAGGREQVGRARLSGVADHGPGWPGGRGARWAAGGAAACGGQDGGQHPAQHRGAASARRAHPPRRRAAARRRDRGGAARRQPRAAVDGSGQPAPLAGDDRRPGPGRRLRSAGDGNGPAGLVAPGGAGDRPRRHQDQRDPAQWAAARPAPGQPAQLRLAAAALHRQPAAQHPVARVRRRARHEDQRVRHRGSGKRRDRAIRRRRCALCPSGPAVHPARASAGPRRDPARRATGAEAAGRARRDARRPAYAH